MPYAKPFVKKVSHETLGINDNYRTVWERVLDYLWTRSFWHHDSNMQLGFRATLVRGTQSCYLSCILKIWMAFDRKFPYAKRLMDSTYLTRLYAILSAIYPCKTEYDILPVSVNIISQHGNKWTHSDEHRTLDSFVGELINKLGLWNHVTGTGSESYIENNLTMVKMDKMTEMGRYKHLFTIKWRVNFDLSFLENMKKERCECCLACGTALKRAPTKLRKENYAMGFLPMVDMTGSIIVRKCFESPEYSVGLEL